MLTNKDVASEMGCNRDTLRSRCKLTKTKPTFSGYSGHRWTRKQADLLFQRWSDYTQKKYVTPSKALGKGTRKSLPHQTQRTRRNRHGAH